MDRTVPHLEDFPEVLSDARIRLEIDDAQNIVADKQRLLGAAIAATKAVEDDIKGTHVRPAFTAQMKPLVRIVGGDTCRGANQRPRPRARGART